MEIREIKDKQIWEGFLQSCITKTFLQSWNWGEFNIKMGQKIWRLGVYDGEKLLAVALIIKVSAKRGTFLFIPHGPIMEESQNLKDKKAILDLLIFQLKDTAKSEKASFLRVSPLFLDNEENANVFADVGFRPASMHASAYEATWKLDIFPASVDLLHNMRKTTRYLIRKVSENPDVVIEKSANPQDIETYQKLNKEVSKRQKFVPFSDEHIKNEFEIFNKDGQALFIFGKYLPAGRQVKAEVVAGAMIIFWGGIAFYHQAASIGKFSKLSVPYLLQWEAVKEAENRGCKVYDFWGFTDPEKYPKHPWAGPTLFKMGFGGYKEEYIKTQDYVISSGYWINYFIETIRKKMRGL